jgi:uncharacterized protein (DUF1800 family)
MRVSLFAACSSLSGFLKPPIQEPPTIDRQSRESPMIRHGFAAILLGVLAACGGGGGGGSSSGGGGTGTAPPPPPPRPTQAEAARMLTQATFGVTEATITQVQDAGLTAWVNSQLALPLPSKTHLQFVDERLVELQAVNAGATLSNNQFYESWWRAAASEPDQLRQRVSFALSQIFVISLLDPNIEVRGAASYYDMLHRNAFGNFRTLLNEVTLHPMQGRYLTYLANQKEDPNGSRTPDENYAREVMQLMTIGLVELNPDGTPRLNAQGQQIPSYTPADIAGLAKVFTGISWYHPAPTNSTFFGGNRDPQSAITPMIFYPQYHSTSQKVFLGTTIPANATVDVAGDLNVALNTLFNHPNVGPFISQRLIQQLVTSNPSPAYVGRVAAVFNNNGSGVRGDMAAVVRAILTDTDARSAAGITNPGFGKLREPVIRTTQWMRAFNATSQSGDYLMFSTSASTSLAQSPLSSPSVFNFWRPGFTPPSTTELGSRSLLAPEFQSVDEVTTAGWVNSIQSWVDQGVGNTPPGGSGRDIRSTYASEIAVADNPAALADRVNLLLLNGQMSTALRGRIEAAITAVTIPASNGSNQAAIDTARLNRAKTAIFLSLVSPEYLVQR